MLKIQAVKNILLFRNDRFGEFLLNIPAFRSIKQKYPDARIFLVVNPEVKELAKLIDVVDEVILWENKKHKFSDILKFSRGLREKKIDLSIVFNPSKELHLIVFLAGIPVRIGYNRKWGFLLTEKIEDRKYLGQKHEVEYNLELACLAGAKPEGGSLFLNLKEETVNSQISNFGLNGYNDLITIHPWTSDPIKQWPLDKFVELSRRLAGEPGKKLIIIGGNENKENSAFIFRDLNDKILNLTGKTSLTQLAAILKKCKLLISGDSGPVHLASSIGTPVIAIFRNDIPGKGPKRWGPVGGNNIVVENNSLNKINVDEVFNEAKKILG